MQFSGNLVHKAVNPVQRNQQTTHSDWSAIKETPHIPNQMRALDFATKCTAFWLSV